MRICISGWNGEVAHHFQAARLLGRLGDRDRLGLAFNERWWGRGELKAPIVIGPRFDSGSVASPNRETEGMRDGSDAGVGLALINGLLTWRVRRHLGFVPPRGASASATPARRHGRWSPTGRRKRRGASRASSGTTRLGASQPTPPDRMAAGKLGHSSCRAVPAIASSYGWSMLQTPRRSFQRYRAMRRAASGAPSATTTMPACWE